MTQDTEDGGFAKYESLVGNDLDGPFVPESKAKGDEAVRVEFRHGVDVAGPRPALTKSNQPTPDEAMAMDDCAPEIDGYVSELQSLELFQKMKAIVQSWPRACDREVGVVASWILGDGIEVSVTVRKNPIVC